MKNFYTVEGCDGVGKSHQTKLLKEYCLSHGNTDVVFTREPGGSEIAEKIRNVILDSHNGDMSPLCEAFLFAASRIQHLNDIIVPSLSEGKKVFCDRYVDSSYVYQGIGRNLSVERIRLLNDLAVGEYMPEYTLFLDLPPEKAFERKGGADKNDRMEKESLAFHKALYRGYKQLILQEPQRFIVIDASGSVAETHQAVVRALKIRGVL